MSDWVLDAILGQLAKIARGRGIHEGVKWERPDDNQPPELSHETHDMLSQLIFGKTPENEG